MLDFDGEGRMIGIEVLDVSERMTRPNRMRKNAVLAKRFVEFSYETRALVAENRDSSRLLH